MGYGASVLNDGIGDSLSVDERIRAKQRLIEIMVSEHQRDLENRDDLIQEGRIALWRTMIREDCPSSEAYLHAAARQRINEVATRQTWTGHTRVHGQPTDPLRQPGKVEMEAALDAGLVTVAADVLGAVEMAYHRGEIMKVLAELPYEYRAYVVLRFWGGYTQPEISEILHRQPNNLNRTWQEVIRPRLQRQLAHLVAID